MTSFVPSGSLLFLAIVASLLLSIAFQLLLANLGLAVGLTLAKPALDLASAQPESPSSTSQSRGSRAPESQSPDNGLAGLGAWAGLGLCLGLDMVLFASCFLTVRLSFLQAPVLGATLGLITWAAHLLLLFWVSTTAVGSTLEVLLGGTTAGIRKLLRWVRQTPKDLDDKSDTEKSDTEKSDGDRLNQIQNQLNRALHQLEEMQAQMRDSLHPIASPQISSPQISSPQISPDLSTSASQPDPASDALLPQLREKLTTVLDNLDFDLKAKLQEALAEIDPSDWDLATLWQQMRSPGKLEDSEPESPEPESPKPDSPRLSDAAIADVNTQLQSYFRYTNRKKLTPEGVTQKLEVVLTPWIATDNFPDNFTDNLAIARSAISAIDQAALKTILTHRNSLSPRRVQKLLAPLQQEQPLKANQTAPVPEPGTAIESKALKEPKALTAFKANTLHPVVETLQSLFQDLDLGVEVSQLSWAEVQSVLWEFSSESFEAENLDLEILQERWGRSLHHWTQTAQGAVQTLEDQLKATAQESTALLSHLPEHPLHQLQNQVQSLLGGTLAELQNLPHLPQAAAEQLQTMLTQTQSQIVRQIEQAQAGLETQAQQLQTQAIAQAEAVRHLAAIAAWWLFALVFSSGCTAALAGYWAALQNASCLV